MSLPYRAQQAFLYLSTALRLRHSNLRGRPPESSGELAIAAWKVWEYTNSILVSLKQKFLKVRLTVPCLLIKHRTIWIMTMSQEHVISVSICLQSRCHEASRGSATAPVCTVYREVQLLLFQQLLVCTVPCYCKDQWSKFASQMLFQQHIQTTTIYI